jgi:hypothetical protein
MIKMKKIFQFKYVLLLSALFMACEEDAVINQVLDDVDTSNAYLATSISGAIDLFDVESSRTYDFEFRSKDINLFQEVAFTIRFNDNNPEDGVDNGRDAVAFGSLTKVDFNNIGEYGFPRGSFSYTFQEALDALGLTTDEVNGSDTFVLEWTMTLTDGRTYTSDDVNGNVSAVGAFYSSPYSDTSPVVCLLPETSFVGTYLLEQQTAGNYGTVWDDQEVEVIALSSTERQFSALYLPQFAVGNGPEPFNFELVCGKILVPGEQASGLTCGGVSITFGPADDVGTFDGADESSVLTIIFSEDEASACAGPSVVTVTLTKVD